MGRRRTTLLLGSALVDGSSRRLLLTGDGGASWLSRQWLADRYPDCRTLLRGSYDARPSEASPRHCRRLPTTSWILRACNKMINETTDPHKSPCALRVPLYQRGIRGISLFRES